MAANHRVTVNLEAPEYSQLSALAGKHRISLAWLGRRAIIEFLERTEQEELQLPLKLPSQRADKGHGGESGTFDGDG